MTQKVILSCYNIGGAWEGYLESYDLEYADGVGAAWLTRDPDKALRFDDAKAAMDAVMSSPKSKPVRDDGEPNRPLRAFTINIQTVGS